MTAGIEALKEYFALLQKSLISYERGQKVTCLISAEVCKITYCDLSHHENINCHISQHKHVADICLNLGIDIEWVGILILVTDL